MILVIGGGVAGLSSALAAAQQFADVHLVVPGACAPETAGAARCNTVMAQGGIAAAIGPNDSPESHTADTLAAGAGLVDATATRVLTTVGAQRVRALIAAGFAVDRSATGAPALGLEAAHAQPRIVHAGEDRTGEGLHQFLVGLVLHQVRAGRIVLTEHHTLTELVLRDGAVAGARLRGPNGAPCVLSADSVVLATGGYAALYARSSNHAGATGSGIVAAARAGALVSDLEFVQFHPTVLAGTGFLISEAVRGAGAVLRNRAGERFLKSVHPAAELAPRDVVARAVHRELQREGADAVWLDATGIEQRGGSGTLARRFPRLTEAVVARGFDWATEAFPVAPAAHYAMGGVSTDLDGRTTVPGLFAAGEVASTGVHGANRLASNSLLEGLVFGDRAGRAAVAYTAPASQQRGAWGFAGGALERMRSEAELVSAPAGTAAVTDESVAPAAQRASEERSTELGKLLDAHLGIERDESGLRSVRSHPATRETSAGTLATLIAEAALARTESRGAHQRTDYPQTKPESAHRSGWLLAPTSTPVLAYAGAATETRSLTAC